MKALFLILLSIVVFGSASYFTWVILFKPQQELQHEQRLPPAPPPPDETIPEFNKAAELHKAGNTLEARAALQAFVERYPESTKLDEAKNRLGEINSDIFFSPTPAPEKQVYVVKSGDVLNRVAKGLKVTPELLARVNDLKSNATGNIILRIGQRLVVSPAEFSVVIDRAGQKVALLNKGQFFKQYPVASMPAKAHAAATPAKKGAPVKPPKIAGKVTDKIAWKDGARITFSDKGYFEADHWVVIAPATYTLYAERVAGPNEPPPQKPPNGGVGLTPEQMRELAVMLRKGDAVSIE